MAFISGSLLLAALACGCDAGEKDGQGGGIDAGPLDPFGPDAAPPTATVSVCADGHATYATIGEAVAAAPAGAEVQVCPGTYKEHVVVSGKALYLVGTGGAATTIVDGTSNGAPFTVQATGDALVAIEGFTVTNGSASGIRCDASKLRVRNVVAKTNVSGSAGGGGVLSKGCTIDLDTVQLTGNRSPERGGGALFIDSQGAIHDSVIADNAANDGGGLADLEGNVVIQANTIRHNTAAVLGGGIYHESSSLVADNQITGNTGNWTSGGVHVVKHEPTLRNNVVEGNTSKNDGGGIYLDQSAAFLDHNQIRANHCGDDGGGIRVFTSHARLVGNLVEDNIADDCGGGIRVSHLSSTLTDNVVRNNKATNTGGGMDLDNDSSVVTGGEVSGNKASRGGGIYMWMAPWNDGRIEDVTISGNRAWHGGGIALEDNFQPLTLRGLTVSGNTADRGGGVYFASTPLTFTNSIITGNKANDKGGAIYAGAPPEWTAECPCPPQNPHAEIAFVVAHGNTAPNGAAVYSSFGDLLVTSSIFADNTGTQVMAGGADETPLDVKTPRWEYNDVFPASFAGMAPGGSGNVASDPMFMAPETDNFHLQSASPCVDAGDPARHDADGSRADMGYFGGSP